MTRSDVVIVGAGAAGLSAGLVLARAQASVTVIDAGSPRNAPAAEMHGFLSRDGIPPREFLELGREEVLSYGGSIVSDTVLDVAVTASGTFTVTLHSSDAVSGRAILVATGLTDQLPRIAGLEEKWGTLIHHCPYCHGYEVRNKSIVVVGSPAKEMSIRQAGLLRRYSDRVSFITHGMDLTPEERHGLEAFGVRVVVGRVAHFAGEPGFLDGVVIDGGATIECEAAFIAPQPRPNDRILDDLGCRRDDSTGMVVVDAFGKTSISGVWAAGNVVTPTAQVITAAGAGSASAIAISGWLLQQDLDVATAARPQEGAPPCHRPPTRPQPPRPPFTLER
ncbi:NAD(P)/FAD-dependent oxidoreductase [Herbiconiux ginsengi]|uniref:Thioredoxin reductase n=1 Tax=Herbiconiux ginsengi TaxID=381665 RepID=A0A1H3KJ24_9MICO|nr:NAD(P)/FAD-dependent oxidoreductase [Herbiconiux ginsengi]SDY52191.1 Thioredoxin reductase [Herbiconiux ginsengi]